MSMRMYPYFHKVGVSLKALAKDNRGELGTILILPIMMIISLFVVATLGTAVIPSAITSASNTSAISGYSTWTSQTQTTMATVPTFLGIDYMFVYIIILLFAVTVISKVAA